MYGVDWDRPHSCWIIISVLKGRHLASQTKVEFSHVIVAGVVGSHGCENFNDGAEVLLDLSLLDGFPLRGQKAGTGALGENLEERYQVSDVVDFRFDVHSAAKVPPLTPGGGVFLEEC